MSHRDTMKALVLKEYNKFSFEEVPSPEIGPGDVLVKVKACGICGSDVHGMDGSTGRRRPPIIMGHEAAGVIARSSVPGSPWAEGVPVTFDSTIYCGECGFCRRGEINLCDRRRVLGVSCEEYRQHGAFAEYVAVPERILYRIPEGVTFEHAALVEPYSIALHAVHRAPPPLNARVVVIGAGMIGLALVQVLTQAGCGELVAVDVATDRLELARKVGATIIINSGQPDALGELRKVTSGQGADICFEAVGLTATVDLAMRCVRKGGSVVLVGNVTPAVEFPLQVAVTREISVHGSCASRGEYPACLDMLRRGAVNPEPLISAVAPLAEGADWFERLHRREPGLLKVILKS